MTLPVAAEGRIKREIVDGVAVWSLQCPLCWCWGGIDDDQLHGRISTDHTDQGEGRPGSLIEGAPCTFHETRDWLSTAEIVT